MLSNPLLEKLAADTITLSGALQIVGGAVTLSGNGLKAVNSNGSYTLFDEEGMNFYDSNGVKFAGIGRFMIGVAADGQYVSFTQPWDITPTIIVIPQQLQTSVAGYSTLDLDIISNAIEVSKSGFRAQIRTILKAGSGGSQVLNYTLLNNVNVIQNQNYTASKIVKPPDGATKLSATLNVTVKGSTYTHTRPGATPNLPPIIDTFVGATANASIYLKKNNVIVDSQENVAGNYVEYTTNVTLSCSFTDGDVLTIEAKGFGSQYESGYGAWTTVILSSIQYDVASESVISTGTGTFIVTDGNSANYTIA